MCRGGVTGQGKFPKKMWFFGRFSEQRAKKNSAQINRYNWHFLCSLQVDVIPKKWKQPLIFWIELFDFHILEMQTLPNAKLWSLAGLDLCNLCESASWPVLAYIHSQVYLCLCYRHTTPKYPLWLIWGRGSFLTCSQSGKAASENSKSSREDLYWCTLPTGLRNPSWDQNAHRNERTTLLISNWSTFNDSMTFCDKPGTEYLRETKWHLWHTCCT